MRLSALRIGMVVAAQTWPKMPIRLPPLLTRSRAIAVAFMPQLMARYGLIAGALISAPRDVA